MAPRKKTKVIEETGAVNTSPVKAGAEKTEPVKPSTPDQAVEMPKEEQTAAKAPSEKKTKAAKSAEDKPAVKKTAAKKEMKVKAVVEYQGKQVEEKDIIASVKKAWTKSGKKVRDLKSVDLYIKPEEEKVYYVINGTDTGSVAF